MLAIFTFNTLLALKPTPLPKEIVFRKDNANDGDYGYAHWGYIGTTRKGMENRKIGIDERIKIWGLFQNGPV